MKRFAFLAIREPSYWNTWLLSICMHTLMVGMALFLSHQIPTPQRADRNPIAVSFVAPQATHTPPTHRPTMKKSPRTSTAQMKLAQPETIPREPTQSRPHRRFQRRQMVAPQKIVHPSPKFAPQPIPQLTNVTPTPVNQSTTVRRTQMTSQPTVRRGTISPQPIAHTVGQATPKTSAQHTGITRQLTAVKGHAPPSQRKSIHVSPTAETFDLITPRNQVIHHHVTIATPVRSAPPRQSVRTLPSHDEMRTRAQAMAVMKRQVTRGKSHTPVKHSFSMPLHQSALLSSGSPVVRTRTTTSYTLQTKKSRLATNARVATREGFSPELLAFSKLLREKIARTLEFPRLAKRLGYSGTTHVAIALSKTGVVRDLKVAQPSGYKILDKAAIVTLQKVLQTTKPPESIEIEQLIIPIAFNLKKN